jgi:DNA-binding transcriptional LysR family regulator
MQHVHLRDFDLNLLLALDALLEESHVTRAARRLGLSQSAMSHALARLRERLDDALLVRTARGMEPTERARSLMPGLRAALSALDLSLAPAASFDPKTAQHTFRLGVSDYEELTLVRPLLRRLAREAPHLNLLLLMPSDHGRVQESLSRGELDLVLKPLSKQDTAQGIYYQRLLSHDRFVVVARQGNPYVGKRLTLKRFVQAPHALVAPGGTPRGVVDDLLAQRGLSRRIMLCLPHFLVAPHFVAESDLLLTLAERVARRYAPLLKLEVHPIPLPLPGFSVHALWHARTHSDPAQRYLRQALFEVARAEG